MRRRADWLMLGALTTLLASGVAAACGSFGSSDEAAGTDSGTDGQGDGAASDAPASSEASTDASADAGNCVVLLEEHFTGDLGASWTLNAPTPSTVSLDKAAVGNPTAPSLLATATVTAVNSANAAIDRTFFFDAGVGTVTLDFAMTIEGPDGGRAYAELGCESVFRNAAGGQTVAALARYTTGNLAGLVEVVTFSDAGALGDSFAQAHAPGWHQVRITTAADAPASAVVTYEIDGIAQAMVPTSALRTPLPPGTDRVQVVCGLAYTNLAKEAGAPSSFVSVHVDDVVLTRCLP